MTAYLYEKRSHLPHDFRLKLLLVLGDRPLVRIDFVEEGVFFRSFFSWLLPLLTSSIEISGFFLEMVFCLGWW